LDIVGGRGPLRGVDALTGRGVFAAGGVLTGVGDGGTSGVGVGIGDILGVGDGRVFVFRLRLRLKFVLRFALKFAFELKLKFESKFALRFVLVLGAFVLTLIFDGVSPCKSQNMKAPQPSTKTVPRIVNATVFAVLGGGGGGG
jgi:hypothetical protein